MVSRDLCKSVIVSVLRSEFAKCMLSTGSDATNTDGTLRKMATVELLCGYMWLIYSKKKIKFIVNHNDNDGHISWISFENFSQKNL